MPSVAVAQLCSSSSYAALQICCSCRTLGFSPNSTCVSLMILRPNRIKREGSCASTCRSMTELFTSSTSCAHLHLLRSKPRSFGIFKPQRESFLTKLFFTVPVGVMTEDAVFYGVSTLCVFLLAIVASLIYFQFQFNRPNAPETPHDGQQEDAVILHGRVLEAGRRVLQTFNFAPKPAICQPRLKSGLYSRESSTQQYLDSRCRTSSKAGYMRQAHDFTK